MSSAVEVLRDELNYYLDGKITERKHNVQELTESLRKACLALEKQILLLTKAKNRIDLLDKEKIDFLDNKENREIYLIMNRQERIVWQEAREVLENGKQ